MADPLQDPAIVDDRAGNPEMPADPSLVGVLSLIHISEPTRRS